MVIFHLQSGYESYCRAVSVAVHFFFTSAFVWMLLEAIHVHSVLGRRHHTIPLGKAQNMLIGKLEKIPMGRVVNSKCLKIRLILG